MRKLLFIASLLLGMSAQAQKKWTPINGNYSYTDSLQFLRFKNNSAKDSVLTTDTSGKMVFIKNNGGSGGSGTVTSIGVTMPTAFTVTGSPVTTSGTIAITANGTTAQYIRGNGTLQTFPTIPGTPNLQAVTDVGASTNHILRVNDSINLKHQTEIAGGSVSTFYNKNNNGGKNWIAQLTSDSMYGGRVFLSSPTGLGTAEFRVSAHTPNFSTLYTFPYTGVNDGITYNTLALQTDISSAIAALHIPPDVWKEDGDDIRNKNIGNVIIGDTTNPNSGGLVVRNNAGTALGNNIAEFSSLAMPTHLVIKPFDYYGSDFGIGTNTSIKPIIAAIQTSDGTNDIYTFGSAVYSDNITGFTGFNTSNPTCANHFWGGLRFQGIGEGAGKVLVSDALGNATWQTFGSGGTVSSVATGYGLSGGTITTTGTLKVDSAALSLKYKTIARATADSTALAAAIATKGTVSSVATGLGLSGGTITTTGTIALDTANANVISRQRAAATYALISDTALFSRKSMPAYSLRVNNTNAVANATTDNYHSASSGTYSGTITWTGTTAPSGATNHTYSWQQIGNVVWGRITLLYNTAGTVLSNVTFDLPSGMPAPANASGTGGNDDLILPVLAHMQTNTTSVASSVARGYLKVNSTSTGYQFTVTATGAGYKYVVVNFQYFTN